MSEDKKRERETDKSKRRRICRWLVLAAVALAVVFGIVWKSGLLDSRSIDEQFAAIDAELAIPDEENAAVYYWKFFTDPNNAATLENLCDHTPSAYREPWADIEYPELAAKLEKNQAFIQELIDISQMEDAQFPVSIDPYRDFWQALSDLRRAIFLLSWAGANDLAEGRAEAAFSKYRCQMNLARHFSQQPGTYHKVVGTAFEATVYWNVRMAAMCDETNVEQLASLESILEIPLDRGESHAELTTRIDRLVRQKEWSKMSTVQRLKDLWFGSKALRDQEKVRRKIRLRLDATRRAILILFAVRSHEERTGAWPETLEQIEPKLAEEMLTDLQNDGPFAYKLRGDSFVFYSRGPNGKDEGGSASGAADDYPVWPRKIE